jgi:hypothetical protein
MIDGPDAGAMRAPDLSDLRLDGAGHADCADGAAIRVGSAAHKALFCRMLLETFRPYEPSAIRWPRLDDPARQRLVDLPIWSIAVETEEKASVNVLSYAETVRDPLVKRAVELNGFEEGRHRRVLSGLVAAYDIEVPSAPPYAKPRDVEWAFMVTGYSECIDSFFAFGLFELAKRSGYFPRELVELFEPIMQEECRHILFFVNWAAWHRRTMPRWRRPLFAAKALGVWAFLIWERIQTARAVDGGSNFTMTGQAAIQIDLDPATLLDICIAENTRRLARYDDRLVRPKLVPALARIARRLLRLRAALARRPRPAD